MMGDLLEEVYETIDAIKEQDDPHLMEELGDVFLIITMISYMKQQENSFSLNDVLKGISEKLIRRHPHVFSDSDAGNSQEVLKQWNRSRLKLKDESPKNRSLIKYQRVYSS